ncbi:MAG: hypothetical protein FVQ79_11775 [Planctomycetes bacterium]|nr:hypothetical protein [Planctomycetota bacterium]
MSENSFTETSTQSWFSRLGGAFKGIIVGIILFVIAFPVLFLNEGRAVRTYKTLKEGAGQVISLDSGTVDPAYNGKLVHLTGEAITNDILSDVQFGISVNAIKLKRNVQMFQWQEKKKSTTKKKVGGGTKKVTRYDYTTIWSGKVIKSSSFKNVSGHENPQNMIYSSNVQTAKDVTLGGFDLSKSLVGKIGGHENYALDGSAEIPEGVSGKVKIHDGGFYVGADPLSPSVGDLKITFQIVTPQGISLISQQAGSTFEPFLSKTGKNLELLKVGTFSAASMFAAAKSSNTMITWLLRVGGFGLMFLGIVMVLSPLSVLADVLPFLGNLVGAATALVAFLIAAILSLLIIAVSWIVFRPLLGVGLIICSRCIGLPAKGNLETKKTFCIIPINNYNSDVT